MRVASAIPYPPSDPSEPDDPLDPVELPKELPSEPGSSDPVPPSVSAGRTVTVSMIWAPEDMRVLPRDAGSAA